MERHFDPGRSAGHASCRVRFGRDLLIRPVIAPGPASGARDVSGHSFIYAARRGVRTRARCRVAAAPHPWRKP